MQSPVHKPVISVKEARKILGKDGFSLTDKQDGADVNLVRLVEALQGIDTSAPLAKLNETSMSDNNGRRIKF